MKFLQKTKHLFGVIALVLCTACVALGMSFVTYSNAPSVYTATAAEGNVAKVGNTEYATIDEAIAAWTNNTTLTLLSDVTLSNVIKLSSTEKHILDLSTYTMTAASGKDAIQYVINGRSSAGYALDIKADATNPGGITATGATIVKHTKPLSGAPSKDRPITRFYGGVFNASYVVKQGGTFGAGYTGASAPYFQFYGGEYNGTIYTNRSQNQFHGGTFNGNMQMSVDTSAYTLVAGGTFKNLSNSMGSALNSDKFMIASKKEDSVEQFYDKEVYVDDNGYYVIAATEPAQGIEASVAMTPGPNDYLAYSKVAAEGQLNYTDINLAIQNNKTATITVYADEIDLEGIDNFTGTLVVPEGKTLTIKNAPEGLKTEGNVIIKGDKAKIGETGYATLQEAIEAATTGQTITLLEDITENVTINKNLEIDGLKADGTKFNYTGEIAFANQTVTIKNVNFVNGNINQNGSGTAGALTVEACTFTGKNANSKYGGYAIHVANFGNVVVINTDATDINLLYVRLSTLSITVTGGTIDFLDGWGAHIVPDCTVTFNGVTFKNLEVGVVVQNPGSAKYVVFTDCKFMDNTYPVVVWNKANNPVTFTFNGTNEMGSEDWIARIENNNYPFISGYEKAVVNGCQDGATIYGTHTEGEAVEENRVEATVTEEGSYDKVVYCSVCRKELSRETVTIAKIEATVRIGENYYATLAKAIAGATAGQTITLLADITENVTVDKSLTIDGAEFAYTGTMTIINNVTVTIQNVNFVEGTVYTHKNTGKAKNITIQNCTFDGQGFAGYAMNLGGTNSILIENVEVENYYAVLQIPSATSSLCLKDVKIDNINYYGFKIDYAGQVAFDNVTIGENVAFAEGDSWVSGILDSNWGAKTYTITNCTFKNAVPIKVLKREDLINKTTFTFNGENEMSNLVAWDYAIYKLGSYGTTLTAPEGLKVEGSEDKAVVAEYENGMYVAKLHVMRAIKLESDFTICFAFPQVDGLGYVTVNGERFDTTWYTQGTNYVIEYTGIAAKEMAKELTFVVYDSEGNRVSDVMTTSIQSYLVQQLTKIGTGEVNALKTATRTLAVDALNYGAAAQVLFGYNTDALVNSGIEEYQQFASEARTYNSVKDKTSVQGVKINQTLTLENKVNVTFRFVVADSVALSENAKFTVVYTATGEEIPMDEGVEVIDNGNGEFYVYVTALSAKEADKAITCTLVDGGETLGTVTYSIESYAASKAGADDANGRTALAMMKYCDSAKKYFAVKK